jgi:ABC-type transport system involved in cytochrome bd biosynthesis fused ATPase/permease subunit
VLPVVRYFLARLVLFVLAVVVLGLLGAGRAVALFGGLVISVLLSYVLLRRLRDPANAAIAERLQARQERRAAHPDEDELIEDGQVDDALRGELHDGERRG